MMNITFRIFFLIALANISGIYGKVYYFMDGNFLGTNRNLRHHRLVKGIVEGEDESLILHQSLSYYPSNVNECKIYGDNKLIQTELRRKPKNEKIWYLNSKAMNALIDHCNKLASQEFGIADNEINVDLVIPGTKWCGHGSVNDGYNDLGNELKTDKCCRTHDVCPHFIRPRMADSATGLYNHHKLTV